MSLIEIEDAFSRIMGELSPNSIETVGFDDLVGRTLAADINSDLDLPPFSKSLVDGFAIGSQEPGDDGCFEILETVTAGQIPSKPLQSGQAARVMTGAPIPQGTFGVVMVEQTTLERNRVKVESQLLKKSQNVLRQGDVIRKGDPFVEAGQRLDPHHVGLFAEQGICEIPVHRRTKVAVLATGDELVLPTQTPLGGQIRNSNGPMLSQLAKRWGAEPADLGIGRDEKSDLETRVKEGLDSDILVISGGVSAGILDLVPQCLADAGVDKVFHKINLKPGKPLWFGIGPQGQLVFGLPGNPISALVCFRLFVAPTIQVQMGVSPASILTPDRDMVRMEPVQLATEFTYSGGRRTFWPCQFSAANGKTVASTLDWKGSADQVTYCRANGLIELQGDPRLMRAGESAPGIRLDR